MCYGQWLIPLLNFFKPNYLCFVLWELIIYLSPQRRVRSWSWQCKRLGSPPGWYRVAICGQVRFSVGANPWGKSFKTLFCVSPKEMGDLLDWCPLKIHGESSSFLRERQIRSDGHMCPQSFRFHCHWSFRSAWELAFPHVCVLSHFSCVWLFVTPWTVARQAPLSMGFPRQEYCSGLTFPPQGDLLDKGIKPSSLMSPALAGRFFTNSPTWEAQAGFPQAPVKGKFVSGWWPETLLRVYSGLSSLFKAVFH